jgi:hypothetical protein
MSDEKPRCASCGGPVVRFPTWDHCQRCFDEVKRVHGLFADIRGHSRVRRGLHRQANGEDQ